MIPALLRTRSTAEALLRRTASHASVLQRASCMVAPPELALPTPESLTNQLVALGVDRCAADRISGIFEHFASRLRTICESDYRSRRQSPELRSHFFHDVKSSTLMPSAYYAIYARRLSSWRAYLVDDVTPRILEAWSIRRGDGGRPTNSPTRRPFNQDALPVLEQFFELNAFPSRLEKHELATRCDMSYKQIHVWFQNRRSRFRKEGGVLMKADDNVLLRQLEDTVVDVLLPLSSGDEDCSDFMGDNMSAEPTCDDLAASKAFDFQPPPHAFPTPYPPLCSYEPFPIVKGRQDFQLPWLRLPSSQRRVASGPVDMSALAAAFTKLTINEDASNVQHLRPARHFSNTNSVRFFLSFATPCSCAPHPALIRKPRTQRSSCSPSLSLRSRTPLQSPAKKVAGPTRPPTAATSNPSVRSARPRRTLPRRVPKHPPARGQTPDERRLSTTSRASSISSLSSTCSDVVTPLSTPLLPMLPPPTVAPPSPFISTDAFGFLLECPDTTDGIIHMAKIPHLDLD